MEKLLKLIGFRQNQIERNMGRFERTFGILGLDENDIDRACERVSTFFPIEIEGCRELLCLHMETLLDLVLSREDKKKKIIYADWPMPVTLLAAAKVAAPDAGIFTPGQILNVNLGQIFGKIAPIIAAGEESGLAAGQAHCPLYQTHLGAIVKGIIPMPDLEIASGFHCDAPGAVMQLVNQLYGIPISFLDGCYDSQWGEWPRPDANAREIEYFGKCTERCLEDMFDVVGRRVSEEIQHQAVTHYAKLYYNFQMLLEVFAKADRQPFSQACVCLMTWLFNTPLTPEQYERATYATKSLYLEAQQRIEKGEGISPKGAPKLHFATLIAVDPSIVKMVEDTGVNVAVCLWALLPPCARYKAGNKTFGERVAGQIRRVGGFLGSYGIVRTYTDYVREYKLDGVILPYSISCPPYAMAALMVKHAIQRELDVPVIVLEGDFYDTRNYSLEQMRTRIETFTQVLKLQKKADA